MVKANHALSNSAPVDKNPYTDSCFNLSTTATSLQQPPFLSPMLTVVARLNCNTFLTFKPTTVHCSDNLLGNRTSSHDESSAESESDDKEDVALSSDDDLESDQGQEEFHNTSMLSFVKNSVISWNVCRLSNPQKAKKMWESKAEVGKVVRNG